MGTRGLLGLIIQAQRHAAYNHYDSYPSSLGQEIVAFILGLKPEEYAEIDKLVREITWVDGKLPPSTELQDKYSKLGFSDLTVNVKSLADWYCLLRNVQGFAALPAIQKGELKHIVDEVKFLQDGLFCEWAYFIDFENHKLETWKDGKKFDEISFEDLAKVGKEYMKELENRGRKEEE